MRNGKEGRRRGSLPAAAGRRRPTAAAGLALLLAGGSLGCDDASGGTWGPTLTAVETGATRPTAAVDPAGESVYVAWVGTGGEAPDVYLARVGPAGADAPDDGPRISSPVRVNRIPGDAAAAGQAPARVAVGPGGEVYVAWTRDTLVAGRRWPATDLRFARSTDGGRSFEPAVTVNRDSAGVPSSHSFHDLEVGPEGTLYLSWIDGRRRDRYLAEHPDAEAEGEAPELEIRVASSTDRGRTFGRGAVVDSGPCPCCRTTLAAGGDGSLHVAWRKLFEKDVRDIVVARSTDGGRSFSSPVRVAADDWTFPACPHAGPGLVTDEEGRLHMAWYTGKEAAPGLYYARTEGARTEGGEMKFGSAVPLLTDERVPPSQVALGPGDAGSLWLAWEDRRPERARFRLSRVAADRDPRPDDATVLPGVLPDLAAADSLQALAWLDGEAVRVRLRRAGGR